MLNYTHRFIKQIPAHTAFKITLCFLFGITVGFLFIFFHTDVPTEKVEWRDDGFLITFPTEQKDSGIFWEQSQNANRILIIPHDNLQEKQYIIYPTENAAGSF